jgi:hypothetical protein
MPRYNPLAETICIISHNVNRSTIVIDALLNSSCATADIILIQEANITDPQFAITNPGFTLIIPPRGDQTSNRTAAYITRSNAYLHMTQRTDICDDPDLQVLEVGTDLIPSFFLLNIYNQRDPQTKIYTIPHALAPVPLPPRCVITGDLNAHHGLWNSLVQEPKRADELVTLIENRDWVMVSVPDEATYHFKNGMGSSVLDLTLALPAMLEEVINWALDTDQATGSNHEVIRFQVISTHPNAETPTPEPHLNWWKTDWPKFSNTLHSLSVETQPQ